MYPICKNLVRLTCKIADFYTRIFTVFFFKKGDCGQPDKVRQAVDMSLSLSFCSIVIWLGDLNYRFDDLEVDQIKVLIENNKLDELYKFDQV